MVMRYASIIIPVDEYVELCFIMEMNDRDAVNQDL